MARIVFFGTPPEAVPSLRSLNAISNVEVVVTRPDKPRGRSGVPRPSAVKEAAEAWGLTVVQPDAAVGAASRLEGVDLAVVVAYGRLLPVEMLTLPRCGFINVHFSRLPRWRGAAPVARAILSGDSVTGVDIIQLDAGMDTGPLIARMVAEIDPADTSGGLTARLAEVGAALLEKTVPTILDGSAQFTPQSETGATLAAKLTSSEARLDPHAMSAEACDRVVRAFNPNPGAWGLVDGERLKVWASARLDETRVPVGETALVDGRAVLGTVDGSLELVEVQPAGKGRMAGNAWARGRRGALHWE